MIDGTNEAPESAVRTVAKLAEGEAYCRVKFIPAIHITPELIRQTKRELAQALSPVIARARKLSFASYRMHNIHSFTSDYDVVVAGVIVREKEL
jgi:hypothetical protein